ncbi:MAG: hypothetical protein AAFX06_29555, partial [Planctomycetota bacterium]
MAGRKSAGQTFVDTGRTELDRCGEDSARRRIVARRTWLVAVLAFACCQIAISATHAQAPATNAQGQATQAPATHAGMPVVNAAAESVAVGPSIRASGDTVHRWQIQDAQASLLIGDCLLLRGDQEIRADKILIVSDGPRGKVRNRVVLEGRQTKDGKEQRPRSAVWMTEKEPAVQAPLYKTEPDVRPFLMEYLPSSSIASVGSAPSDLAAPALLQTQYAEPTGNAPTPTLAAPLELSTADGFTPAQLPPTTGLPLAPQSSPPIITEDGATTGGFQFYFGGGSKSVTFER